MSWKVKTPASPEAFLEIAWLAGGLPFAQADRGRTARNHAGHAISDSVNPTKVISGEAVVEFWRAAGPTLWFAKDADFDRRFRERFLDLHEAAARGELSDWLSTPTGALALVILLDQFPRNAFRGTPRMYKTDQMAREIASDAIVAGYDEAIEAEMRLFLYLPFAHSESLPDQLLSVELGKRLGEPNLSHARRHCAIVQRFGRFPHRNPILGRTMRPEEQQYLDEGGYRG
ncbi:DUF924 family protein [Phyllobacterium endophyticum]|uniref:DUF924 domain-containing protein n=1 Tax=Phyllobacterium endophyticum TaxID=1149773 RepID=A0A2P7AR75_9HYPH|nr:DUF924 family protein [Phyllobacterium endophyticum]MBB3237330.1 uncharacterized protein (DUF924 family) [Phyllobacterium endophyticum]PSH56690.1 hypothetical protein CU100_15150 [Phyllobacterium endophyticum]TYR44322.1 DUF924 family protein [Phyllobacterium endophyticum]